MAAVINKRDAALQAATPRTITVNLGASVNVNGTVSGNVTGTLSGTAVATVVNAALSATSNYFNEGTTNPTGGADGDAYYNATTSTMWFNIAGVWKIGGTVNANQITTGTLASARIAAGSIDATKLNVTTLSAITANLGSVTAGNITGTANINITGIGQFGGNGSAGGYNAAILANNGQISANGVVSWSGSSATAAAIIGLGQSANTYGVVGYAVGSGSTGVLGLSFPASGIGVTASNTNPGGVALKVDGLMTISSTTLVANLNADRVDGFHAASLAKLAGGNTWSGGQFFGTDIDVNGWVQCNNFRIDQTPTTGAATATFPGNNKPGAGSTVQWVPVNVNGSNGYMPWWPA